MINNKKAHMALACLMFLLLAAFLVQALDFAVANPIGMTPAPHMPEIVIGKDGKITPENAPVNKTGTLYTLTRDIVGYCIKIQCSNVIFDGAGQTLQAGNLGYAPSSGITIFSSEITVKNVNIDQYHESGIYTSGAHNTIVNCSVTPRFGSGIELQGNYNNIIGNTIHGGGINLYGNYNTIQRNLLIGRGIYMSDSVVSRPDSGAPPEYNIIAANTMRDCPFAVFAVYPSTGTNVFYLNNFINNTNGNISAYRWQLVENDEPALRWTPNATWRGIYPNSTLFDNSSVGNYWSDYNGTDADGDGIGDKPYYIGGILQDNYPLILPTDISNSTIPEYQWTTAQNPTTPTLTLTPASTSSTSATPSLPTTTPTPTIATPSPTPSGTNNPTQQTMQPALTTNLSPYVNEVIASDFRPIIVGTFAVAVAIICTGTLIYLKKQK